MKTEQAPDQMSAAEVFDPEVGTARGILMPAPHEGRFRHTRRRPPEDLAPWVEHYWSVHWDLRGCEPFLQQTLPHPSVHIVFEDGRSGIAGVSTARFSRTLEGNSSVFGVKFRPGGFRLFLRASVATLADRVVPIESVFGTAGSDWQSTMLGVEGEDVQMTCASGFLRAQLPVPDPHSKTAAQLVKQIFEDSALRTVSDLSRRSGISVRSLQRLFSEYVGASPKRVIRRYRLHELVERFKAGEALDGAQTALDLSYFDQAHLINDFRDIVGYSPSRYRTRLRREH